MFTGLSALTESERLHPAQASASEETGLEEMVLSETNLVEGRLMSARPSGCGGAPHTLVELSCQPPVLQRIRCSGGLGHLAGANAGGAHAQSLTSPVNDCMNTLEVRVPPAPGDVVSVAHIISVRRTFAANFAMTRHQILL